jgi:hypothetical protein
MILQPIETNSKMKKNYKFYRLVFINCHDMSFANPYYFDSIVSLLTYKVLYHEKKES